MIEFQSFFTKLHKPNKLPFLQIYFTIHNNFFKVIKNNLVYYIYKYTFWHKSERCRSSNYLESILIEARFQSNNLFFSFVNVDQRKFFRLRKKNRQFLTQLVKLGELVCQKQTRVDFLGQVHEPKFYF